MNEQRKLIYADDLLKQFPVGGGVTAERARRAIERAEAVDAVDVVRCESCCFSEGIPADREDAYYSDRVLHCRLLRGNYDPDGVSAVWRNGYCDEGERKEEHNG